MAGAVGDTASDAASGLGRAASRATDKVSDAAHAAGSAMGLTGDRASETRAYGAPLSPESLQPSTALGTEGAAGYGASERTRSPSERNETIPVVEEQLNVGKREVEGGRVRVRSYVVEQPVQEQVNLRDESVNVERRPVDRPLTGADRDRAFQERTIEAEEKSEEAVVNKEARVKEELVVNKDVNQRTETVSDTVRRTEVDVQDERGTGRTASNIDPTAPPPQTYLNHRSRTGARFLTTPHISGSGPWASSGPSSSASSRRCRETHSAGTERAYRFRPSTTLGIIGAFVATVLGQAVGWYRVGEGAGLIGAVVGAAIVLAAWGAIIGPRSTTSTL